MTSGFSVSGLRFYAALFLEGIAVWVPDREDCRLGSGSGGLPFGFRMEIKTVYMGAI
jgi:hypothetical protein